MTRKGHYHNREGQVVSQVSYDWLRKYGLVEKQFRALRIAQEDKCAICGQPETTRYRGIVRALSVDHDHITGKVRGLLCQKCNLGLGSFADDPLRLLKAIWYLGLSSEISEKDLTFSG